MRLSHQHKWELALSDFGQTNLGTAGVNWPPLFDIDAFVAAMLEINGHPFEGVIEYTVEPRDSNDGMGWYQPVRITIRK